jgi:diadenylate cyclase
MLLALLVIFQPELRRGLMWLGKYGVLYAITSSSKRPVVDKLSDAAEVLAGQFVGALIAIEREIPLTVYVETGTRVDAEVSPLLIRAIFQKQSPLHDGAMIVSNGRIVAAGCQLPLSPVEVSSKNLHGMRHRAALGTSEETDAILLVVSEETGRITLASAGQLEAVPRENLSRRLAELLESNTAHVREIKQNANKNDIEANKNDIAFGNQIRNYVLHPYQLVKDLRSGYETSQTNKILDGDLNDIIYSLIIS